MRKKDIDLVDIEILNLLAENAYLTNRELSGKIGLSESAALVRVKALLKKGAISKQVAIIEHQYFGYSSTYFLSITLNGDLTEELLTKLEGFSFITSIDEVAAIGLSLGSSRNFLISMLDKDGSQVSQVLNLLAGYPQTVISTSQSKGIKKYKTNGFTLGEDDIS